MAFVNFSVLAFGSLLMGVPILLHLLMRQRPRHQVFPAIRFLHLRQISNKRQMRLRNWLLLALRLAAVGLLAALLARPSVDSAGLGAWLKALLLAVLSPLVVVGLVFAWLHQRGRLLLGTLAMMSILLCGGLLYQSYLALTAGADSSIGDAHAPVVAALVFDTSPRMGLQHENQTRLDAARTIAHALLKQLPTDSEVAIIDSSSAMTTFSVDLGTAVNIVDSLEMDGREHPLHQLVARGVELVRQRDDKRKEVYVLTDLSQQAWQEANYRSVARHLAEHPDLLFFLLDVGVREPRNFHLEPLRLTADSLARGRPLRIESTVTSLNAGGDVVAEVFIEQPDPTRPVIIDGEMLLPEAPQRDRMQLTVAAGQTSPINFEIRGLPVGVHHGRVQISADDGLLVDNTRHFTVEVHEPWPILLATSSGAQARYVESVLSPYTSRARGEAWFDCHVIEADQLTDHTLSDYAVVGLIDPSPMTATHWRQLSEFVTSGGSLAMFLGRNAQPQAVSVDEFNKIVGALLPAKLKLQWRTAMGEHLFISPREFSHPILAVFRGRETLIPWDQSPIFRHWSFEQLNEGASVVTRFSNNQPAVIESVLGRGRVVTMATPVSDPRNDPARPAWNYLPTIDQPLPFFMLIRGVFLHLAQRVEQHWNYAAGEAVALQVAEVAAEDRSWQLITPAGDWQNVRSEQGVVTLANTDFPGTYRLRSDRPNDPVFGVSVNLPTNATDLRRVDPKLLDDVLGEDRYTLARGSEELNRGVGRARVGRELYPFLILVVVGVLVMEQLMSNRFYSVRPPARRRSDTSSARAA